MNCELCGSPKKRNRRFCGRMCSAKHVAATRKVDHEVLRAAARRRARAGADNPNYRGGKASHPLYFTYHDMVGRCVRETHARYASYGGRGIAVCDRWRDDFWAFVADMGERPPGLSLDRIDNDGPYAPENCRWATCSQQSKNRRPSAYAGSQRNDKGQYT